MTKDARRYYAEKTIRNINMVTSYVSKSKAESEAAKDDNDKTGRVIYEIRHYKGDEIHSRFDRTKDHKVKKAKFHVIGEVSGHLFGVYTTYALANKVAEDILDDQPILVVEVK